MNTKLQKEIIKHIFNQLGIIETTIRISLIEKIIDNKFLIDKKMAFEIDGIKYENGVWAAQGKLAEHTVKILVADIKEDINEYAIIFQMDKLPIYALRLSKDDTDDGSIYFYHNDKWIDCDIATQCKFLYGIESISSTLLDWSKLDQYTDLYRQIISFLNYYGSLEE